MPSLYKNESQIFAGCENGGIFQIDLLKNKILGRFTNPMGSQNFDLLYDITSKKLWAGAAYLKKDKWKYPKVWNNISKELLNLNTRKFQKLHINSNRELIGCNSAGFLAIDLKNDSVIFFFFFWWDNRTYSRNPYYTK